MAAGIGVRLGAAEEVTVLLFKVAFRGSRIRWILFGSFGCCMELCVDPVQFKLGRLKAGKVPHWPSTS